MADSRIVLELTVNEAKILCKMIQHHNPAIEDEMIVLMLFNRLTSKLKEKNE